SDKILFLSLKNKEICDASFSVQEIEKLANIGSENRKTEYILGRHALKEVLSKINHDNDTSKISWPHLNCSLSHSDGYAVAVSCLESQGIGIDLQLNKTPPATMAERILSKQSFAYWQALPNENKATELQRLWTVNEAIYKACPVPQQPNFRCYQLSSPQCMQSDGFIDDTQYQFSIHSAKLVHGYITIALRR
ncbi:MAG TPA: 4'-phosphopantetheinyl transferase superfamily protein, partial [Arenimonas sp.]|nr:4'-phosphopantetheinyl transferase superfamily protein [Arenimonas sp.]